MGKDTQPSVWMYESLSLSSITGKTAIPISFLPFRAVCLSLSLLYFSAKNVYVWKFISGNIHCLLDFTPYLNTKVYSHVVFVIVHQFIVTECLNKANTYNGVFII